ncbi:MAG TPA: 4-(cytidine 5'-diphospho)-2-C-methyl-D-erythritol kinase [Verrucomicrobiota bacterium]|nr:4-(cytidine 5'-diphospho)-2-C-methyl-D-erythritol kinase [Verrucomicrobiota bacterium]HNU51816.1 4-(cytidine 5'-diphospho)-2-C-methyl-D-erythritol kinase [Verrucomicrobiota bacterium]
MGLILESPCKVNLLLNVLGRRADGFHELETVMHPVAWCDTLEFEPCRAGIALVCSDPDLAVDGTNLVHRAATRFFAAAGLNAGVRIRLTKRIPLEAGLGGGSGNAATTLLGLNRLFGDPLGEARLTSLAAELGSDVPFFLGRGPAVATGRGERVQRLPALSALDGVWVVLIHPGFGIPTAWAYQSLARFPQALAGVPGRAARLVERLRSGTLEAAAGDFYNALEAPALAKYPILGMYQEFLRREGALATLMSGSGSTTFALVRERAAAERLRARFTAEFGPSAWTAVTTLTLLGAGVFPLA